MKDVRKDNSFLKLFIVILFETALFMLMGMVDTVMLSAFSEDAVTAVGLANQALNLGRMVFMIISTGTIIIISQYIGAKRIERASNISITSIIFAFILGLFLSILFLNLDDVILRLLNTDSEKYGSSVYPDAKKYMNIVTLAMAITATNPVMASIFRGFKKAKYSLYISLVSNILNVFGNAVFIFGLFGMPQLGVIGVAYSTVAAIIFRTVASLLVFFFILKIKPSLGFIKNFFKFMIEIIKVGTPTALEGITYNMMQFVVLIIITSIGQTEVNTRIYMLNLTMFIFLTSMAFSQTNQIFVGNYVGAKENDKAFKITNWSFKYALAASLSMTLLFNIFNDQVLGIFTDNPEVISLGKKLLVITFFVESGRALNLVYQGAFKGSGDVYFPLKIAVTFMIFMALPLTYFLGITLGLGLIGVWLAYAADELTRGIIGIIFWYKKTWVNKAVIDRNEDLVEELEEVLS